MKKRIIALAVGVFIMLSMMPTFAFAANHYIYNDIKEIDITTGTVTFTNNTTNTWNLSTGDHIDIYATNPVTVRGTNKVCITGNANSDITLDNVTINMRDFYNGSPLSFWGTGSTLTLVGDSTIIGTDKSTHDSTPGVSVRSGNAVTIDSTTGGSLTAVGGYECAGIGSSQNFTAGTITINGGTITATGGMRGAGIGSGREGANGNIIINGGKITANGGYYGAGIGGGYDGDGGNITINGGIVTATQSSTGTGIGGGAMGAGATIKIYGGEVYAQGYGEGDDIGVLYSSSNKGSVNISGDAAVFLSNNKIVTPTTTHTKVYHETISGNSAYGYTNIPSSWSGTATAYLPLTTYVINDTTIAAYGSTVDLKNISTAIKKIQVDTTQSVTIKNSMQVDREIEIDCVRSNVDLTIENVHIDVSGIVGGTALSFTGANNELTLVGDSTFKSDNTQPAISVGSGGSLSINSNLDGKLYAVGSLGNATGQINILGGRIYAQSYDGSVNIGGTSAVFGIDASAFNSPTTTSHTYVDSDDIVNNHAYGYSGFPDSWSNTAYGYIANPYTIRFVDDDGVSVIDTLKVSDGKKINKDNTPMKAGYTMNWYKHSTLHVMSLWDFDADIPTYDMDLYAEYVLDVYNISYHLDGGINNPANKSTYTHNDNDITLLDASKNGYTFDGWYDNASFSGSAITLLVTSDDEDKEYYAKWTANSATIAFDGNGSTSGNVPSDISSVTDASISLPANTGNLARIGYIFEGWSEAVDGSKITGLYAVPVGGSTLYAVWSVDASVPRYDVDFDVQGGSAVSNQIVPEGDFASKPNNPNRNEYSFGGWYTDVACQDDDRWNFDACQVMRDITLYAKWISNSSTVSYDVSFNSQGGSAVSGQTIIEGAYVDKPNNPNRNGYIFAGWYTDVACQDDDRWNFNACQVTRGIVLYAKWISDSTAVGHITDVEFDNTYKALRKSATYDVSAVCPYTLYPTNAIDKSVSFTSSNSTVATILDGKITANEEGRAIITIVANDDVNGTIKSKMMIEVIDSTAAGLSASSTSLVGNVVDGNGKALSNILVTTYSDPMDTLTDSSTGEFEYHSLPFTHHTLVLNNDNGEEIGRYTLDFNKSHEQSIEVDNSNNIVSINYADFTKFIDLTIQVNDTLSNINITNSDIIGSNVVINPKTGYGNIDIWEYLLGIILCICILMVNKFFKRKERAV